jgi:hypothetical protein
MVSKDETIFKEEGMLYVWLVYTVSEMAAKKHSCGGAEYFPATFGRSPFPALRATLTGRDAA